MRAATHVVVACSACCAQCVCVPCALHVVRAPCSACRVVQVSCGAGCTHCVLRAVRVACNVCCVRCVLRNVVAFVATYVVALQLLQLRCNLRRCVEACVVAWQLAWCNLRVATCVLQLACCNLRVALHRACCVAICVVAQLRCILRGCVAICAVA